MSAFSAEPASQNAPTRPSSTVDEAAKLRRAQAIRDSLKQAGPIPIRCESPTIPSGGVDAVAARTKAAFQAEAVRLELDENVSMSVVGNGAGFNGFQSARGMKRVISGGDAQK